MPVEITARPPSKAEMKRIVIAARNKALQDTGRYIQSKAAKYPPQRPETTYRRTGTLGRSITVGEVQELPGGAYVEVGTNIKYARYVEEGTGIYGPKGQVIRPKYAKVLAWQATAGALKKAGRAGHLLIAMGLGRRKGKTVHRQAKDVYLIFAKYVRGMPAWHFMRKAFEAPDSQAYFRRRIEAMLREIQKAAG